MLKEFAANGAAYMPIGHAQKFDQRPFRSMLVRKWIAYHPGHGFHITREGRAAWEEFRTTPILRLHPDRPLTRYFDPIACGLTDPYKLHVMPRSGAA
jgi:hypothetical protein